MAKKIAVVVRDRQSEALRMAVGMILLDDIIDVYVLDRKVEDNDQNNLNLETMGDLDISLYTNTKENGNMIKLTTREIADRLLDYDTVLMY
ncbi:hypothetical protein LCGC14_2921170 [marine sediment metagenome]|uniref:Uncharacterized protein n=1 Tax=marine sediment metagenome TaxID=412755 RepID=A0A0F8XNU4_9ZZZZ